MKSVAGAFEVAPGQILTLWKLPERDPIIAYSDTIERGVYFWVSAVASRRSQRLVSIWGRSSR